MTNGNWDARHKWWHSIAVISIGIVGVTLSGVGGVEARRYTSCCRDAGGKGIWCPMLDRDIGARTMVLFVDVVSFPQGNRLAVWSG